MASEYENDIRAVGFQQLKRYDELMKAYIEAINLTCSHLGHTHTSDEVFDEGYIKRFTNPYDIRRLHNENSLLEYTQLYGSITLDVDSYGTFVFDLMGTLSISLSVSTNNDNLDSKADPNDLTKTFARRLDFYITSNGYKITWPDSVTWVLGEDRLATNDVTYITMVSFDNGETWLAANMTYAYINNVTIDGVEIATDKEVEEMLDEVFGNAHQYEPEPDVDPMSGTLVIEGDLNTDLAVDGNIVVNGDINATSVKATGTIKYGSITSGNIQQGNSAEDEYDIIVEDGTATVKNTVDKVDDVLHTSGTFLNEEGAEVTFNCAFTIDTTSQNAIENTNGTLVVSSNGNLSATTSYSTGRGIYNHNENGIVIVESNGRMTVKATGANSRGVYNYTSGGMTINGTLEADGVSYGLYNNCELVVNGRIYAYSDNTPVSNTNGTISGSGVVYANNQLYYNGA